MRQFSDASPCKESLWKRRLEALWYLLAPVLVMIVISGLGLFAAIAYIKKDPKGQKTPITERAFYNKNGIIDHELLINTYFARKGLSIDQALDYSVHYMGTYEQGGRTIAFKGVSNLLGVGRLELAFGINEIVVDFTPDVISKSEDPLLNDQLMAIKAISKSFQNPLLIYRLAPDEFEIQCAHKTAYGQAIIEIELSQKSGDTQHRIQLDADSLNILKRIDMKHFTTEGQLRFYDYKPSDGIEFSTRIISKSPFGELIPVHLFQINTEIGDGGLASQ